MSLHEDLREQARHLAKRERRRPKQASLRRAISTAYYALFHLLIEEAGRSLVPGPHDRWPLRHGLARAFQHTTMKEAAKGFAAGNLPRRIASALGASTLQPELRYVANTFLDLQQSRHEADYNTAIRFTRTEVLADLDSLDRAFRNWHTVRRTLPA